MAAGPTKMPLRHLLLASDLSARCDRALDRAAMLASERSAQLTVVHAFEPDVYAMSNDPRPEPSWRQQPDLKQAIALKQLRHDLGPLDVSFDLILEDGEPADVILRAASRLSGDLIVTGIARGETFGRFVFGGTVDQLVRKATIPVLVVKSRARKPYKDIVVATDFSEASRNAIVATFTMFPNANIVLLHCYEPDLSSIARPVVSGNAARQVASSDYRHFLNAAPEMTADLAKLPVFLEEGSIDRVIQAYAADKNLDLLVIGSHGKNAVLRALIGSTAERAMASAPTDVLVVTSR